MDKFTYKTFSKLMVLRAVSAASLILMMIAFLATSFIPSSMTLAVALAGFTFVWVLTAPVVTVHYVYGIVPNLRWPLARKRTLSTLPGLAGLAERMGAPLPRWIKLVANDKPNARTDGTTLSITTGLEPYIGTWVGEAILAHELAHAKLGHFIRHAWAACGMGFVTLLFLGQFSVLDDVTGAVVGAVAFITLLAFVSPLMSRKMEYEADALAAQFVGRSAMIGALKTLVPTEKRGLESDSHPSIRARVQRLRNC